MTRKISIDFEQELNPQQLEVVTSAPGPALVIAGAGSGKTRTLTYRVAYLIEQGCDPGSILLLTFTNKAAREMTGRVESIVPGEVKRIWGGTFHHIANRILRVHIHRLGYEPNYTILDQGDTNSFLDSCLQDLGHKKKESVLPQGSVLHSIISLARNTCTELPDVLEQRFPYFLDFSEEIEQVEKHFTQKKHAQNLLDFDDLLLLWLRLLQQDVGLRDYYTRRFVNILVDEYQDTNRLQADIIDILAAHHRNVMVVGDDSQSIYAFRGAHFANIMEFPKRYPDAHMYKLEHNYRSSPEILFLANESIRYNTNQFRKVLQPTKEQGPQPLVITPQDVHYQARTVGEAINEYIYSGTQPRDIAVLYRAHFHSMELQMELGRRMLPFEVRSGYKFFEQAHIKDISSYLKILINPFDEVAWTRVLRLLPGIGEKTSRKIFTALSGSQDPLSAVGTDTCFSMVPKAAKQYWGNITGIVNALREIGTAVAPAPLITAALEYGYRDLMRAKYMNAIERNEDIDRFTELAWQYESLQDFLSELALMTSTEADDVNRDPVHEQITLSTIHQAKGLEWSVVFIICLVEGRFPNPQNIDSLEDEEEERRLFYVAATRAKDALVLCVPRYAKDSTGYTSLLKPSRFLREIPQECYTANNAADQDHYDYCE